MAVWLSPDDVAKRLKVCRRTAMTLMQQMPHSVIGGVERKRIRVTETNLDAWMMKQAVGKPIVSIETGSRRKLQRR